MTLVTCNNCGWVHAGRSRKEIEAEVRVVNEFYDGAPEHMRQSYIQQAGVENYEKCFRCGGSWKNMRESRSGACPRGSTIPSILMEVI